ncbi:hypothetical protein ACFQH6_10175 [Halobacteriaceae archaeon GCM10025711]
MSQQTERSRARLASDRFADAAERLDGRGRQLRVVTGVVALASVGALAALRAAVNAPVAVPDAVLAVSTPARTAAVVGPALAAFALALTTDDVVERIGLLAVAVFPTLALLSPTAVLPATGALAAGGGIAVVRGLSRRRDYRTARRWVVAGVVLVGVTASLASSLGVAPGQLRPFGSTLALLGVALVPVFARPGSVGWFLGGLAGMTVVWAGLTAPFVTGAVLLVGAGVVGASTLVVAAGVGGAVAAATGGVTDGNFLVACGVGVLLLAGVPATVPRRSPPSSGWRWL